MNPRLNKKVKKDLDAYFKGTSASSPEAHHAIMFILKGALTDANFHSTSKKVDKLFPKAKGAKYFGKREWEDNLESKGMDIAAAAKWDGHDILDAIGFFVSMYIGRPLGSKIEDLKNESLNKEHKLLENLSVLVEKNVPTNPSKWSYYKSQAKKKFDVYPSAYANAWAAKQYKAAGGGWRTTKENVEETIEEKVSVFDERHVGKNGIIIMIDDNGKKVSAIFKNKKNADKYNRNKSSDLQTLLKLAKNTPYPKAIDESVNEAKEPEVITTLRKIVKNKQNDLIKDTKSGKKVRVDMNSANLMVQVYDALKKQSNKDKFVKSGIVMMGHTSYKLMKKENITEYDVENGQDIREFVEFIESYKVDINEAEYQGRKVELGKISQGDVKKFKVYVKNAKGNVVKVNFGQKGMTIKKGNPGARKSFRARMNCDSPGPRWKARYWSCRKW